MQQALQRSICLCATAVCKRSAFDRPWREGGRQLRSRNDCANEHDTCTFLTAHSRKTKICTYTYIYIYMLYLVCMYHQTKSLFPCPSPVSLKCCKSEKASILVLCCTTLDRSCGILDRQILRSFRLVALLGCNIAALPLLLLIRQKMPLITQHRCCCCCCQRGKQKRLL